MVCYTQKLLLFAFMLVGVAGSMAYGGPIATNNWSIATSSDTGATGTVTDTSVPGFSADFTMVRSGVVSFGGATWSGGAHLNVSNASSGPNPGTGDSVDLALSFSNVSGGAIQSIISHYGTVSNNDVDATWQYTWTGGGMATLTDPDNQMDEADGFMFASGGLVTNATSELPASSHTWYVTIPADQVTLAWDSPTHAFIEAMAFHVVAAPVSADIPEPASAGLVLASLWGLGRLALGRGRTRR